MNKVVILCCLINSLAFAGMPDEDLTVAGLRSKFESCGAPSAELLTKGDWYCSHHIAERGEFNVGLTKSLIFEQNDNGFVLHGIDLGFRNTLENLEASENEISSVRKLSDKVILSSYRQCRDGSLVNELSVESPSAWAELKPVVKFAPSTARVVSYGICRRRNYYKPAKEIKKTIRYLEIRDITNFTTTKYDCVTSLNFDWFDQTSKRYDFEIIANTVSGQVVLAKSKGVKRVSDFYIESGKCGSFSFVENELYSDKFLDQALEIGEANAHSSDYIQYALSDKNVYKQNNRCKVKRLTIADYENGRTMIEAISDHQIPCPSSGFVDLPDAPVKPNDKAWSCSVTCGSVKHGYAIGELATDDTAETAFRKASEACGKAWASNPKTKNWKLDFWGHSYTIINGTINNIVPATFANSCVKN